jgi:hypothetical protein
VDHAARRTLRSERHLAGGVSVDKDTYYFMQKPWLAWNCQAGELRMVERFTN